MQFESSSWWLFPDQLPVVGEMFEFCELQAYGKKGQVLVFIGRIADRVGDWQVFPSRVRNLKEIVKQLGGDDKEWQGKKFILAPTEDKKQIVLRIV